jgi:endonuclease-3
MITSKKKRREVIAEADKRLEEYYPDVVCALEYGGDPWRLLVMGRLSAQCTDARVNIVCRELFAKYGNAEAMACADIREVEEIVKPCGLYRMKAENIVMASRMITEKGGRIPDTMDELLELPGIGRKIANLILGDVYGKPAVVCDTHFMRICARLGMYPADLRDPNKIERIMTELFDTSRGADFCHRIVHFGREICSARSPKCDGCILNDICDFASKCGGVYGKKD